MHRDRPIADRLADMLGDLRGAGLSDRELGAAMDASRVTAWRYRNGLAVEPTWRRVEAIEELHAAKVGERSR
jgi:hypothetical protein